MDVLYYIFFELYVAMPYLFDDIRLSSFFSGIGAFEKAPRPILFYHFPTGATTVISDFFCASAGGCSLPLSKRSLST